MEFLAIVNVQRRHKVSQLQQGTQSRHVISLAFLILRSAYACSTLLLPSVLLNILVFAEQDGLVRPLFVSRIFAAVALGPAGSAIELAVAADAAEGGVVVADRAPG